MRLWKQGNDLQLLSTSHIPFCVLFGCVYMNKWDFQRTVPRSRGCCWHVGCVPSAGLGAALLCASHTSSCRRRGPGQGEEVSLNNMNSR